MKRKGRRNVSKQSNKKRGNREVSLEGTLENNDDKYGKQRKCGMRRGEKCGRGRERKKKRIKTKKIKERKQKSEVMRKMRKSGDRKGL